MNNQDVHGRAVKLAPPCSKTQKQNNTKILNNLPPWHVIKIMQITKRKLLSFTTHSSSEATARRAQSTVHSSQVNLIQHT